MKRAEYKIRGPVPQDLIDVVEFELPPLKSGQVLIAVVAAPINPSDVLTLTGQYGILPPLPAVGGNEGVGQIVEIGPNVEGMSVGQVVLLPVSSGSWTTHMIAEATRLIPLPSEVDPKQLCMLTINPPTALLLLSEFVDLQPGDWVIQNAANSAVGGYLIQIAKMRGLKTINIVRRESAMASIKEIGGDVVLVDGENLHERVASATQGAKPRLGIDAVGGRATEFMAKCLAESGVLVNYGGMSGEPCILSPASLVFSNVTLRGFWLSRWFRNATPQRQRQVFTELVSLIATGKLKARIHATYSLDQIKQAVARAASGERNGKILIEPNR